MIGIDEAITDMELRLPFVRPLFEEHMRDFDELLPHLLFGDIVRWVEGSPPPHELAALLFCLDIYYSLGDNETRNVIDASFIEDLPVRSPVFDQFGPAMAASGMTAYRRDIDSK